MGRKPIIESKTKIYFDYFVEQWNSHNKSISNIADGIMEEFGLLVDISHLAKTKQRYAPHFEPRSKTVSALIGGETNRMNKKLRSSRRELVLKALKDK